MLTRNPLCAMKTANVVAVVVFSLLAAKYTRKRQQSGGFTTERHAWYIEIDSWPKKSFFIYIYIHYPHTNVRYTCILPESIVRILYTYNKYNRSYTTTWCTFNKIRNIIYIYFIQNIFKLRFSTGAFNA